MSTFAAIDIGSNSCRLAIASVQAHKLKTLHEDREVTRLGESVFETGVISPEAMAVTVKALKRFHKAVQAHVVDQVRVVATSAMRDARNSEAFRAWVKSATGWTVEVISGLEEGRLIHLGVVTHEPGARGKCLKAAHRLKPGSSRVFENLRFKSSHRICRRQPMSNDVVADPPVNIRRHHPLVQQIELASVGPEPHDPTGPRSRQPRHLHQLRDRRPVQVDGLSRPSRPSRDSSRRHGN